MPGESIQAAIDAAQPGDTIKIKAGTYHENVYVNKDFIELEGAGAAQDVPPASGGGDARTRACRATGRSSGRLRRLRPDAGRGLRARGHDDPNFLNGAFLVNTAGAEVKHVVFANNQVYGAFYNDSTGGEFHDNVAYGSEEAGLYFGDSPNADVEVEDNEVYDNGYGLFFRDAANGEVEDNYAHDNCFGILVLNTGEPGGASGWKIDDNKVNDNNKACPASDEAPPTSGAGIVLAGASNNVVKRQQGQRQRALRALAARVGWDRARVDGRLRRHTGVGQPHQEQPTSTATSRTTSATTARARATRSTTTTATPRSRRGCAPDRIAVARFVRRCSVEQAAAVDERYEPATIDVEKDTAVTLTFLDGYIAEFDLLTLRKGCPCAACRGLRDQQQLAWPRPDSPMPLRIESANLHGAWGLAISWNDGHSTGIFPFESLRRWHEGHPAFPPDSGLG